MDIKHQKKLAAKTQRYFSTLAFKEGKYHEKEAKRNYTLGNHILAKFHRNEAKLCKQFGERRLKIAEKYESEIN